IACALQPPVAFQAAAFPRSCHLLFKNVLKHIFKCVSGELVQIGIPRTRIASAATDLRGPSALPSSLRFVSRPSAFERHLITLAQKHPSATRGIVCVGQQLARPTPTKVPPTSDTGDPTSTINSLRGCLL